MTSVHTRFGQHSLRFLWFEAVSPKVPIKMQICYSEGAIHQAFHTSARISLSDGGCVWRVIRPLGMGDRRPVLIGKGKTGLFSEPFAGVPGWAFAIALKAVFSDFPRETTPSLEFFQ